MSKFMKMIQMLKYNGPISSLVGNYESVYDLLEAESELEQSCKHINIIRTTGQNKRGTYFRAHCLDCGRVRLNKENLNE